MEITIPRYTVGTDIETKDVTASAYILSVGCVTFDNYTLKPTAVLSVTFDPEDPLQHERTASPRTLDWWHTDGPNNPCSVAREATWNGSTDFKTGMEQVDGYFRSLPFGKFVMPMKGPDFDYVILKHALRELRMYKTPLHATPLDSSRTIERINKSLDIPPINDVEHQRFWKHGTPLPHVAVYDAAYEGYEAARLYHCLHLVKILGYDRMLAEVEMWQTKPDSVKPLNEWEITNEEVKV